MKAILCWLVGVACLAAQAQSTKLIVHEWGTFTSLQNEAGNTVPGINTDEEPLPDFVHDLHGSEGTITVFHGKGAPLHYPEITMRLETPVIYFYAPAAEPLTVDVKVAFRGGWLTQFFPDALQTAPGAFYQLSEKTVGTLTWPKLKIGGDASGPETTARVWTAPREVRATSVTATNGERERYVFYRGVGHLDAPLRVARRNGEFAIHSQLDSAAAYQLAIETLWLVESRPDGAFAYRALKPLKLAADSQGVLATTPASFRETDFSGGNLEALRNEMREAMVKDGLFADEADALLNTWEVSYFKSAGQRLFFFVPRPWTDHYLPLELSTPAELTRLMIGRIELVTPEQRGSPGKLRRLPFLNNRCLSWPSCARRLSQRRFPRPILRSDVFATHS